MRTKFILAGMLLTWARLHALAQEEPASALPAALPGELPGARAFTTPAAVTAQSTYTADMKAARLKCAAELDQAMKVALTAGNLDDANAINATCQKLAADGLLVASAAFKTAQANDARRRYETTVSNVQRQYGRDLQQALKGAMSSANLNEANEINAELKALVAALAPAAPSAPPPPVGLPAPKARGLQIVRYPQHTSQATGQNYDGNVSVADMGKPLGAPKTVKSLSIWTKAVDENAVVSGFIKIEKAGTYGFRTNSDFDRNELVIDGRIVCKFRDGSNEPQSVRLKAGLLPITSIGYAVRTTEVRIQWKPPGQEWSDIPDDLLFH